MTLLMFSFIAIVLCLQVYLALAINLIDDSIKGLYNLIRVESDEIRVESDEIRVEPDEIQEESYK